MNNVLFVKSLQLIAFGNNHSGRTLDEIGDAVTNNRENLERLEVLGTDDSTDSKYTITLFNKKETSGKLSGDSVDTLSVKPLYITDGESDIFSLEFSRNAVYFGEGVPKVLYCGILLANGSIDTARIYSHELHGKRIETGTQYIDFRNDYNVSELREAFNLTTGNLDLKGMERYIMLAYARDSIIDKIFLVQCIDLGAGE